MRKIGVKQFFFLFFSARTEKGVGGVGEGEGEGGEGKGGGLAGLGLSPPLRRLI